MTVGDAAAPQPLIIAKIGEPASLSVASVVLETHSAPVSLDPTALDDEAAITAVLTDAVELMGRTIGASRAFYGEIDEDTATVNVVMDWTNGVPSLRGRYPVAVNTQAFRDLVRTGIDVVEDLDTSNQPLAEREVHRANRNLAWIAVTLSRAGRAVAVAGVSHHHPRAFTDAEVALVRDTAERTWETLARATTLRRLRESRAGTVARAGHEAFFRAVGDAIREDRDEASIVTKIVTMLAPHLGVTGASLSEIDAFDPLKLSCCRFRGHRDKVFLRPEGVHATTEVQS